MKLHPPQRPLRFLRWFCREDYLEEIEGDLVEVFERQAGVSVHHARRVFTWSVVRYFRPRFIKTFRSHYPGNAMSILRHNLLITLRSFVRHKSSFLINLTGLSTGLACVLLIYLWVNDELQVDQFHENKARIYKVLENRVQADRIWTAESSSAPTADALAADIPEVEYAATTAWTDVHTLSIDERPIKASGRYASKDYFNIFTFPILHGRKGDMLKEKNNIVLSESLARKLFNRADETVLGEIVEIDHARQYTVAGIFQDLPYQATEKADFIRSFEEFRADHPDWVSTWFSTGAATYVMVKEGTDVNAVNAKIAGYVKQKTNGEVTHRTMFLKRYTDKYLYGHFENGIESGGRITYVKLFSVIAAFILVIACINFMNLSTARASRRMKEIGIKKAVGAKRNTLVWQHLGESLLLSIISMAIAVGLVVVLLPYFNVMTEKQLTLPLTLVFVERVLGVVIFTGLLAGSYPALYLSGFHPAAILKGKLTSATGELWVRKGLVVFQFTCSVIFIVAVIVVYRQTEYIQSRSLGYSKDNMIVFEREGKVAEAERLESFLAGVRNIPGVHNASSIAHTLTGHNSGTSGVIWEGKDQNDRTEFENVAVSYDMVETLGIQVVEGRSFSRDFPSDTAHIIFNEAAIAFMGLKDPVGKVIKLWGDDMEIIGIARNFHFESLHETVRPLFFRLSPENTGRIMVKIEPGQEQATVQRLEQFYETYNPGFIFDFRFLDDNYQSQYRAEQRVAVLSRYFAGLAILISCLGLFGLTAFTLERREKEIGIRKVLGSGELRIVLLLSRDFTKMVLLSIALALPLSYFLTNSWLSTFAFRIDLSAGYFVLSGVIALAITWITVGLQALRAARLNPVQALKRE
jgi:putative ABC transport system permease protein